MPGMLNRTVTYSRVERITIHLTSAGIVQLLEQANEIPKGFKIESVEFEPGDIVLVRDEPTDSA